MRLRQPIVPRGRNLFPRWQRGCSGCHTRIRHLRAALSLSLYADVVLSMVGAESDRTKGGDPASRSDGFQWRRSGPRLVADCVRDGRLSLRWKIVPRVAGELRGLPHPDSPLSCHQIPLRNDPAPGGVPRVVPKGFLGATQIPEVFPQCSPPRNVSVARRVPHGRHQLACRQLWAQTRCGAWHVGNRCRLVCNGGPQGSFAGRRAQSLSGAVR